MELHHDAYGGTLENSRMCNRARMRGEPETLFGSVAELFTERPRDNRFDPQELRPKGRAYVIREESGQRAWDIMSWDILGGKSPWQMTNIRRLAEPQWRRLAECPENRCIVPLTEFCEFTPDRHDLGDGKPPLKGEMWFGVTDQPTFAVAGFWQTTAVGDAFAMVTGDANELVVPIHPKAMVTILKPEADVAGHAARAAGCGTCVTVILFTISKLPRLLNGYGAEF